MCLPVVVVRTSRRVIPNVPVRPSTELSTVLHAAALFIHCVIYARLTFEDLRS